LISALLKIAKNPDVPHVPTEVRQMFIENPPSRFSLGHLFDTHPPIEKRIAVLEALGGHAPDRVAAPPHAGDVAPPLGGPWAPPEKKGPWG